MMHFVALYWGQFAQGGVVDVELTAIAVAVSLVAGILGAVGRLFGGRWLGAAIAAYVEIIRGLPPILQLFIIFFGLTQFGLDLAPFTAGLLWLAMYGAGYAVEIFRAGILAIHEGQQEAAEALGMNRWEALRAIILPQAWVVMLPSLTSFLVLQLKNTTLLYLIGVSDIMYQAQVGSSATSQPGIFYGMAAVAYLILNLGISRVGGYLERRTAAYR
jgi:His/Glu/Gln/Arg/opine family amino acid ABC transporter permease subunit